MTAFKSRWLVGSSNSSRVGSMNSARAKETRMRHPPENWFVGRPCISASKPRPAKQEKWNSWWFPLIFSIFFEIQKQYLTFWFSSRCSCASRTQYCLFLINLSTASHTNWNFVPCEQENKFHFMKMLRKNPNCLCHWVCWKMFSHKWRVFQCELFRVEIVKKHFEYITRTHNN